jgi:TPP-dependent pyruvate/acetoin dehydrogenase alpha subunit
MLEDGVAGEAEIKGIEKEIRDLVNRAVASAKAASAPVAAELARAVTP